MKLSSIRLTKASVYGGNGFDSAAITQISNSIGIKSYDSHGALPSSADSGTQAYILDSNLYFLYDGEDWYSTTLTRSAPTASSLSGIDTTPSRNTLLSKLENSTIIQLIATDADSNPLQYSLESDGNLRNLATFTQDSSIFTFTPLDSSLATVDSSLVTFKVSDGISFATLSETINFSHFNDSNDWRNSYQLEFNKGPDHGANDELGGQYGINITPDGKCITSFYVRRFNNMFIAPGALLTWTKNDSTGSYDLIQNMWTNTNTVWGTGSYNRISDDGLHLVLNEGNFTANLTEQGRFIYLNRDSVGGEFIERNEVRGLAANANIPGRIHINSGSYDYMLAAATDEDSGDISVYTRSSNTWTKQREIFTPSNVSVTHALSKDGKKVLWYGDSVGYFESDWSEPAGWSAIKTYQYEVWERTGEKWSQHSIVPIPEEIRLRSAVDNTITGYAGAIAIDSAFETLVVGAPRYTKSREKAAAGLSDPDSNQGAVFVFKYDGADSWELTQRIDGQGNIPGDPTIRFGNTLTLSRDGNVLFVEDVVDSDHYFGTGYHREVVMVYNRVGDGFEKISELSRNPSGIDAGTTIGFGDNIETTADGKSVVIGARYVDSDTTYGGSGTQVNRGDIHLFRTHPFDKANINLYAVNNANVSYNFTGKMRSANSVDYETVSDLTDNATIRVNTGDLVRIRVNAGGHPFWIRTTQSTGTGSTIDDIENNGTEDGVITWNPKFSGTYYYNCQFHSSMRGSIIVTDHEKYTGVI